MNGKHPLWIGLTGGIGSGKSTAAACFQQLGAMVLDADEISRHAMDPGVACYDDVVALFGVETLNADGTVNRKKVAEAVFHDVQMREKLNAIIHPYVVKKLLEEAEKASEGQMVLFDVPLLFECGLWEQMEACVAVVSDMEIRLERVMQRDGSTREHVLSRMQAQLSTEELVLRCDYVLDNSGTQEQLLLKVRELYATLMRRHPC